MIALQILIGILLVIVGIILLALLLCIPSVRVHASYLKGEMRLSVHYLFLRYVIFPLAPEEPEEPEKPVKEKKAKKKKKKPPEPPTPEEEKVKAALKDTLEQYKPLISAVRRSLRKMLKRIHIYKIEAGLDLVGGDAHKTALLYAKAANGINIFILLLEDLFTVRVKYLRVSPDFISEKTRLNLSLRIKMRPITVIPVGISLFFAYLKTLPPRKKRRSIFSKNKSKGGKNNG